ncbi:MAG: OmpA family protein [Hyphomicrobiaceae bacterium]
MKCKPWRWLWGLIPILMLGWIAILGEREHIEADLTSRTTTVLERSGFGWASVQFEGRDAVLSGRAIEESDPPKAVAAALDTMGVRVVDNRATLVDTVASYEWTALRKDNRIRVNGSVPSDKSRRDVIGMVKANFPSLDVDDRMRLARGAPPVDVWLGGVGFGLKQLALLREGRIDLENTSISVSGTALDARSYRAVKAALSGQLPQGIRLKNEAVRPPTASPYVWSAERHGKEIALAGHVPNDGVRDEFMRAARRAVPGAKIVDRLEPAFGAPARFVEVASALLEQLGRLESGTAKIRDQVATLNGVAETAEQANQVKVAMAEGVLIAFRTSGQIRHREPVIRTISPYETSAVVEAGSIVLSGYVPDEKARDAVAALARQRFAGLEIRDDLQIGAGQPPGWERCVEVGLDALRKLGNGRAALTGRRLQLSGTTDAEALAQSLPASVRTEAGSSCDTEVRLTLDLAAIQQREAARRKAEDDARQAQLAKQNEEERARLEAERQRSEEAKKLQTEVERRRIEDEERRRAEAAAAQQADEERRRAEAAAAQQADEERRRAEAAAAQQAEEERRRAEAEERAKADADRLAKLTPTEKKKVVDFCQDALSRVVREGIINFNRASFDLDPASYPTLNKVADAANRCPALVVEIEGHTDSEGTPERNKRLSDRRANAVREYLSRAGVEPSRLEAIGYGETRPIAPNDTASGRAMNRRIEFTVKLKQ